MRWSNQVQPDLRTDNLPVIINDVISHSVPGLTFVTYLKIKISSSKSSLLSVILLEILFYLYFLERVDLIFSPLVGGVSSSPNLF